MIHGVGTGDYRQYITNNNNNNNIRIIIKELGKNRKEESRTRQERGVIFGSILQWLLRQRKNKKRIYVYIQTWGGGTGWGCSFSTARLHHAALG